MRLVAMWRATIFTGNVCHECVHNFMSVSTSLCRWCPLSCLSLFKWYRQPAVVDTSGAFFERSHSFAVSGFRTGFQGLYKKHFLLIFERLKKYLFQIVLSLHSPNPNVHVTLLFLFLLPRIDPFVHALGSIFVVRACVV